MARGTKVTMNDRTDDRPRSISGVPIGATDQELAAIQAAIGDAADQWADEVEVDVPEGDLPSDHGVWPEFAYANDEQLANLAERTRDAVKRASR
jgi:hypothetical protein